ncbi:MAG: hypothetical protein KGZ83_19020 [Sulfuricella sp.]|nr:hypothetical protein [Sulfuricella sp.]
MNITPDVIRAARMRAGLNEVQAAALVETSLDCWLDWECGAARMPYGLYELFLAKTHMGQPKRPASGAKKPKGFAY